MGIYVAKASAIRDLLMKHYPQARSPSACRPLGTFMQHASLQPCRGCMSARACVTAQGCLVPCSCRMCNPAHTMQGSAVQVACLLSLGDTGVLQACAVYKGDPNHWQMFLPASLPGTPGFAAWLTPAALRAGERLWQRDHPGRQGHGHARPGLPVPGLLGGHRDRGGVL